MLRAGLFPKEHAKLLTSWSPTGMRGTGSNDFTIENLFVPEDFTFDWLDARSAWQVGAFASIPFPLQLGGFLSAVILGTARHALDTLNELAQAKVPVASRSTLRERPIAQIQIAQAEGLLGAARAYFYQCYDDIWRRGQVGQSFNLADRARARLASVTSAKLALQAIDLVADAGGISSVQTTSAIERCWRDAHTASQHVLLNSSRFEVIGRVLFGLDPGSPVI